MKKISIALAALAVAAFTLPAFAQGVDSSSPKDDKATHKDAVEKKQQSNAGTGATGDTTSDTKTSKKAKKAKKPMKSDTNAGSGSTTAGDDNKATSGTSSPAKP